MRNSALIHPLHLELETANYKENEHGEYFDWWVSMHCSVRSLQRI